MKFLFVTLILSVFSVVCADEKNPSIMFQKQPENLDYLTTPAGQDDEMSARCAEMSRQIDELRGKPQRRYIVIKRYEIECKGAGIDYEKYDNHGVTK